jgi:hypothetical protein
MCKLRVGHNCTTAGNANDRRRIRAATSEIIAAIAAIQPGKFRHLAIP